MNQKVARTDLTGWSPSHLRALTPAMGCPMRPSKMEGALPPKESKGLLTAWRGHDLGQISNIIFYEVGIFPVKRYVMSSGD